MKTWHWIIIGTLVGVIVGLLVDDALGLFVGGAVGAGGAAAKARSGRRATDEPPEFDDSELTKVIQDDAKDPEPVDSGNPFDDILNDSRR